MKTRLLVLLLAGAACAAEPPPLIPRPAELHLHGGRFSGAKRIVTDGPFAETKELVAGFWLWQVKSKAEAIEWAKRCPNPMPGSEATLCDGDTCSLQSSVTANIPAGAGLFVVSVDGFSQSKHGDYTLTTSRP